MTSPARARRPLQEFSTRDRLRRVAKVLLGVVVVPLVIGAVVVLVLATTPWGNERVRRIAVSQANGRLTGRLAIDRLRGNLLSGATLTGVQLHDSAGE